MEAVEKGTEKYKKKFYILHLFKKELAAVSVSNTMLQKACCFPDRKWSPAEVMEVHPTSTKSLYECDPKNGLLKLLWTVPGWEDCKSIRKNPKVYDADLVKWVKEAVEPLEKAI